ncbi:hypothetical protein ABI59_16350 [Acidobacteria bacterium Mor1]|nr:hypothetical protein ABI59_16350 [Acidobacteria bacterium Mor1]
MLLRLAFLVATFTLTALVALPAAADDKGGYIGIGTAQTTADLGLADIDDGSLSGAFDDEDSGFRVFGGYRFGRVLGLELSYSDLGAVAFDGMSDGSQSLNDGYSAGPVTANVETQLLSVSLTAGVPLGKLVSIYGKAGMHVWAADGSLTESFGEFDLDDFDLAESGTGAVYGAGVEVRPAPKFGLRLEWEVAQDAAVGEADIETVGLSAAFRF